MNVLGKYPRGYYDYIRVTARCIPGDFIIIRYVDCVYLVVATKRERGRRRILLDRPLDNAADFNDSILYTTEPPVNP